MNLFKLTVLIVIVSFVWVGMASATYDATDQAECADQDGYWYDGTCYETEVASLNAQIADLNSRINELLVMLGGEESTTEDEVPGVCQGIEFDRALSMGKTGDDVKCLQTMLNRSLDEPLAETGPGSPGNETSYFGSLTKRGVVRFQERYQQDVLAPYGLRRGTGFVGRTTRRKLNFRLRNWNREQEQQGEQQQSEELTSCETDNDCTLVDENCCGCSSGGGKTCINKDFEESWKSELNCEQKESIACPMVYLCNDLPSGCKCVDNTCQTTE